VEVIYENNTQRFKEIIMCTDWKKHTALHNTSRLFGWRCND